MAYTSEIEKLEKRWAENPKGRNFAPLADAYRKAGELDRAIELCKSGLERHPDYVSAHIVYGRCLVDQRQDIAAGEVFQKVLTLDPENILALRVLAEICERGKRFEEAVGWLTKLLAVDPMNGDAAEHLARAKGQAAAAAKRTEPFVAVVAPAPAAVALSDDDGAADQAALSRAEPVLTETMAELYIKQGHTEDGLHVYQALLAQRPGDVRLRTKVDQLMGKGPPPARSGQSAQAFLRGILARRPVRGEASSLEQAFAAASPEPELPAPGEATRPASDTISLDAIFGDEGGRAGASPPDTPPPAASAAPRPGGGALGGTGGAGSVGGGGAAATAGSATGGFSFDQFFSGGGEAAPGAGGGEPPAKAPGRPSGGKGRPPVEDEAALDQFQAWLKGIKS